MRGTKIMWVGVAVVASVSIFVAGLAIGAKISNNGVSGDFANGFNAAKSMLNKTGLLPTTPNKIMTVGGVIKAVDNNQITIAVSGVTPNPLEDQGPVYRTVNVSGKTAIVAMMSLSAAEMDAANKGFLADLKNGRHPSPPAPFKEQVAKISDLKVGMQISVTSSDDIKDASTINATKISFQGGLPVTAPIPAKKK